MPLEKSNRRSLLKAIGSSTALAGIAGVASAKTGKRTTEQRTGPPEDFEYRTVGDDVKNAVGHLWWMLTVDHGRIDELLALSPAGMAETRRKQETIDQLRSTYEVELERDEQNERELTYHLVNPRIRPLHETEVGHNLLEESSNGKEAAQSVAVSASGGLRREAEQRAEPMHAMELHREMAATAAQDTEFEGDDDLREAADDPDTWPQKCQVCSKDWMSLGDDFDLVEISPDVVEQEVRKAIREIDESASPHHMYVPGGERIGVLDLISHLLPPHVPVGALHVEVTGAAHKDAQEHYENADGVGSDPVDVTELGRALHFLQDLSHPLHTGAIGPQVLATQGTVHFAYKQFVDDNWEVAEDTYDPLIDQFNLGTENQQWEYWMQGTCEAMAEAVSPYSEQVYETIVNNGPYNRDDWDYVVEGSAITGMWTLGAYSHAAISRAGW